MSISPPGPALFLVNAKNAQSDHKPDILNKPEMFIFEVREPKAIKLNLTQSAFLMLIKRKVNSRGKDRNIYRIVPKLILKSRTCGNGSYRLVSERVEEFSFLIRNTDRRWK